jgi:hypothetical protein
MRGLFGLGRIAAITGFGIEAGMAVLSLIIIKGVIGRYIDYGTKIVLRNRQECS